MRPLGKSRDGNVAKSLLRGQETLSAPNQPCDIYPQCFLPPLPPFLLPPPIPYSLSPCRFSLPQSFRFLILASVFLCSLRLLLPSPIAWPLSMNISASGPTHNYLICSFFSQFKLPKERIRVNELAPIWIKLFKAAYRLAALGSVSSLL